MRHIALLSLLTLSLAAQEPPKAPAPAAAPAPKPETVVLAKVGGEAITEADFQATLRLMNQQEQMRVLMTPGGKEEFVKRMAESKLLAVKSRRLGLDKSPAFQQAMARTQEDLLAREFLAKEGPSLQPKLAVSEADVKAYYDAHLDRFKQPDLVSVRHILVSVKRAEGEGGLSDADAKAKIAKIQAELKKPGVKFEDLAKKYTDDPGSKEEGGLYADADPSAWVPEFGAAARTQPIGKVGAPVKTAFGYHLIKVEGRKAARQVPFEEAKATAEKEAQQERQMKVWNELLDSLRKEIPFEILKPQAPAAPPAAEAPKGGKP